MSQWNSDNNGANAPGRRQDNGAGPRPDQVAPNQEHMTDQGYQPGQAYLPGQVQTGEKSGEPAGLEQMDVETRALVYQVAEDLQRQRLTGLGGWLAVFITLYCLSIVSLVIAWLIPDDPYEMAMQGINQLSPAWHMTDALWLLLAAGTLICMFMRKRIAPTLCCILLGFGFLQNTAYTLIDPENALAAMEVELGLNMGFLCAASIILQLALTLAWVAYFNKSKRVKYTFGLETADKSIGKVFQ